MDVFGDPEIMGKRGTDIEDGKCSWLAVVALQRATKEQREFFEVISQWIIHSARKNVKTFL